MVKYDADRLNDQLDKLDARLDNIDIHMAEIKKDLKYHILRTDKLEDRVLPIESHVLMVNGGLKLLGVLAIVMGLIEGILQVTKSFK